MRCLTHKDLDDLAVGSAILGSGGGGNPVNELLMAKHALERYGPPVLLSIDEINDGDFIVPIGFMGAPLVSMEKLPSGRELENLLRTLENTLQRKVRALMPAEIGGANAFAPLTIAGKLGLPILDADMMGRAFPQLQMTSANLMNTSASPAFLADSLGNTVMIEAKNAHSLENIARHVAVSMGSSCAIALYLVDGKTAKQAVIPHTLSQAIAIGSKLAKARDEGEDCMEALLKQTQGICLGSGTIVSILQDLRNGFLEGSVTLLGNNDSLELLFQNEYLFARREGAWLASTPDILMLIESESGTPVLSDSLRYGLKVSLIAIPAPAIWQSEKGLKLVGPSCFGYSIPYHPLVRSLCCTQ